MLRKNIKIFSDEKGVSPVIGVMLMIVVTIILAAAVSGFASNISAQDSAPTATLIVESSSQSAEKIVLKHMSGDTLNMANMRVEIASGSPTVTGYVDNVNVTSGFVGAGDSLEISFGNGGLFEGEDIYQTVSEGETFRISLIDTEAGQVVSTVRPTMWP